MDVQLIDFAHPSEIRTFAKGGRQGDVTGINEQPERRPITMGADSRPVSRRLEEIVVAARALAGDLAGGVPGQDGDLLGDAAARLRRSVIGPLERASAVPRAGAEAGTERAPTGRGDGEPARSPRERLWDWRGKPPCCGRSPGLPTSCWKRLRRCRISPTALRLPPTRSPPEVGWPSCGDPGRAPARGPGRPQRSIPRDQRRAAGELAGRAAAVVAADGALPLRGLGAQAFL